MILYIDHEHASSYWKPSTDWLLAARTRISCCTTCPGIDTELQ